MLSIKLLVSLQLATHYLSSVVFVNYFTASLVLVAPQTPLTQILSLVSMYQTSSLLHYSLHNFVSSPVAYL